MMLRHPRMAELTCGDCRRWIVMLQETPVGIVPKFAERSGVRQERRLGQQTPCGQCPRRSPDNEPASRLSRRNRAAWSMFLRARAGGITDAERDDPIVRQTLSLCQRMWDDWEDERRLRDLRTVVGLTTPGIATGREQPPTRGR